MHSKSTQYKLLLSFSATDSAFSEYSKKDPRLIPPKQPFCLTRWNQRFTYQHLEATVLHPVFLQELDRL